MCSAKHRPNTPPGCDCSMPGRWSETRRLRSARSRKRLVSRARAHFVVRSRRRSARSEEHTSELQSLMRISYAVFCLEKKTESKMAKKGSKKGTYEAEKTM